MNGNLESEFQRRMISEQKNKKSIEEKEPGMRKKIKDKKKTEKERKKGRKRERNPNVHTCACLTSKREKKNPELCPRQLIPQQAGAQASRSSQASPAFLSN